MTASGDPADAPGAERVRFAPSPTGMLHIGGLRTALYNYLVARKAGGAFLLRIEDTDRARFVEDAEEDILSALDWCGLDYDEGPGAGGDFGPYRQSERSDRYRPVAERLVEEGRAYYAFDTPEEIEAMRDENRSDANPQPKYGPRTRRKMNNSLTLPEEETQRLLDEGTDHVIRLKVPKDTGVKFTDEVRGSVSFSTNDLDDQVLLKSDGLPTYHLANVVDDHQMKITCVIRGEEWLSSTPKHKLMYDALGWTMPRVAHLPLIMSPHGGKLSKRDAQEGGIPVSLRDYRQQGYEPEAVLNFIALLGWNPGHEQEVFSLDELVEAFSLGRVAQSSAQFDLDKLKWFNEQHLHRLPPEEVAARSREAVQAEGFTPSEDYLTDVAALMQERITFADDLATDGAFFFEAPEEYEEAGVEKRWKDHSAALLRAFADRLEAADAFDAETVENHLRALADEKDVGAGALIHPARLAVSGRSYGPGVFSMMAVLGQERCLRRLRRAAEVLGEGES
ncbi:MAG: glutamate--tRNA ligase [Bacteroidetes bacterium QS_9_68_14]|nr:MAG: glutamate--tRNA ligase [Bacteroidetes bacterium QS_9_68_14]